MKTHFKIITYLIIALAAILTYSCNKDSITTTLQPVIPIKTFATEIEAKQYCEKVMKEIGNEISRNTTNEAFLNIVYSEIDRKANGEPAALIEAIVKRCELENVELLSPINYSTWNLLLEKFKNVDNNNWYPQIYIPNHSGTAERTEDKYAIVFAADEGQIDFNGYMLTEEGLIDFENLIDEEFALTNEVWIFSISESVEENGSSNGTYTAHESSSYVRAQIDKIRIKDHKESWAGGASEVHLKAFLQFHDFTAPDGLQGPILCDRSSWNPQGYEIKKVPRNDVSNQTQFTVDWKLEDHYHNSNFYIDPVIYHYVIFEYDGFPTFTKYEGCNLANCTEKTLEFRSSQNSYDTYTIYSTIDNIFSSECYPNGISDILLVEGYHRNLSAIEFNTELF